MSSGKPVYILDTNVMVEAHRRYYSFELCPVFWDFLIALHNAGHIFSIDRVRKELEAGKDDLAKWINDTLPDSFFISTVSASVITQYTSMITWVNSRGFKLEAKAEFASVADGWLVAYAKTNADHIVVTQEQPRPEAKKRVLIPDVFVAFKVDYQDTFVMLKQLKASFTWTAP